MARLVDAMGREMGLLTKPEHEAAREAALAGQGRPHDADGPRVHGAAGRDGRHLPAGRRRAPERAHGRAAGTTTRSRSKPAASPAGRFAGSDATIFGAVSLADKLDTLAGYFGIGLMPTGSSDPYGLRRAAQGVIRVLLDFWNAAESESAAEPPRARRRGRWLATALGLTRPAADDGSRSGGVPSRPAALRPGRTRLPARRSGSRPRRPANPTRSTTRTRPGSVSRPCTLSAPKPREDFERLAVAFKRARNILGDGAPTATDPELFAEPAERACTPRSRGWLGKNGDYRGEAARARDAAWTGRPLLRRRARDGRGPEAARQPTRPAGTDPVALLSHRGHLETRRTSVTQYVYFFGGGKADGHKDMKDLLGGKGAGLAEMTNAGLPVPPGFTISTAACNLFQEQKGSLTPEIEAEIERALERLEELMGKTPRRRQGPAARVGAQRRQVLDARDDGHDPEPGPERRVGRRPRGEDRQRALRQGQLPSLHPDVRQRGARDRQGQVRARAPRGQEARTASAPTWT